MAIMHPTDLENYDCTESEREMYHALKEQLPEDYQVFYSIRWFDTDEAGRRKDSECDFLVFDPNFGFLTIEVKGGERIYVEEGEWFLEEYDRDHQLTRRKLKRSPYRQAEESMRHFYKYFLEECRQPYDGVYGSAVAFPRYEIDAPLAADAPEELTIDLSHMKNLKERINQIFHYWRNKENNQVPFSPDQRGRLIQLINRQVSLAAAAGALIEIKKREFAKIDFVQDSILDVLYHYRQARVIGGAGTGKTFIAMKKARRDARQGKRTLFLCRGRELSRFVQGELGPESGVEFRTYEELTAEAGTKYDSIVVDEGQDFDEDMGRTVRQFLRDGEESELYVFYDVNQRLFGGRDDNIFGIGYPPFILRYNIRNTGCIYQHAVEETGLGRDTIANALLGVKPDVRRYTGPLQGIKGLNSIVVRLTQKERVSTRSMVILSDEPYERSILATEKRVGPFDISFDELRNIGDTEICFKTVEEFKGLEADVVLYLKNDYPEAVEDDRCLAREYVAMTRARYYLYVLCTRRD